MSISRFQEVLFNKGCGSALLIGCAAAFVGLSFTQCGKGGAPDDRNVPQAHVIATVGGNPVSAEKVDAQTRAAMNRQTEQYIQYGLTDGLPASAEANIAASELRRAVEQAAALTLAQRAGIKFTDDEILALGTRMTDREIEDKRLELARSGQLRPGATEKDFADAFKRAIGRTPDEQRAVYLADLKKRLVDKEDRLAVLDISATPLLVSLEKAKQTTTEDLVKASYSSLTLKRILLTAKSGPSADPKVQATKILSDLKGSMTFEQAMDRYSVDTPQPKKKVSESTINFPVTQVDAQPELKSLAALKVGEVSEPLNLPEGLSIYKVISIKSDLPKDYEAQKARYKEQYLDRQAGKVVQDEVKKMVDSKEVVWKSSGYEALMRYVRFVETSRTLDAATRMGQAQTIADFAKKAIESSQVFDQRAAVLARYAAIDEVWNSPGADKVSLRDQRIDSLVGYLNGAENFSVRMDLVDLYSQKKDGDDAYQNLLAAAQANIAYDRTGQNHFGDVAGRIVKLKAEGLLNANTEKLVVAEQERWKKDKVDFDRQEVERKTQEEKDRKAAADAEKKMEEDAMKQKKAAPSKTPSGSLAPSSDSVSPPTDPTGGLNSPAAPNAPGSTTGGTTGTTTGGVTG